MENKKLGGLLIVIALITGAIILTYNSSLVEQSHEAGCYQNEGCLILERNLTISHLVVGVFSFILALGFYLLFFNKEKIIKQKEYDLSKLNKEEKEIFFFIRENNDTGCYQSNIVEKFNIQKSKASRILDKLEGLGIIERKRRGMTNIIVLK